MPPPPATERRERRIGHASAVALLFIWTGFLLTSRFSAQVALTSWDTAALRFTGSALMALPLGFIFGWPRLKLRRVVPMVALAGLAFPLFALAGFGFAPAAHGGVMMPGTLPFLTAALTWVVLGEAWTRARLVSLAVVAIGIVLLALDTFGDHPGAWKGDLLFLCASATWAAYTILLRLWRVPAMQATLVAALWPALVYLPVWWVALPSNLAAVSFGAALWQLAYQGAFAVILSGLLFTRAVATIGAARTTTITALTPALAALVAWPLLGEPLGWAGLAGVALVSAGIVIGVAGGQGARVDPRKGHP
jgi:drug/metabolite transporter (DMT)-like permease